MKLHDLSFSIYFLKKLYEKYSEISTFGKVVTAHCKLVLYSTSGIMLIYFSTSGYSYHSSISMTKLLIFVPSYFYEVVVKLSLFYSSSTITVLSAVRIGGDRG